MAKYRVLQGIDYPPNKRAEIGNTVEDIPAASVKWLLDSGIIEDVNNKPAMAEKPVVEASIKVVVEPKGFNHNAKDGDGDGFVQDGTPFQRPVEEK